MTPRESTEAAIVDAAWIGFERCGLHRELRQQLTKVLDSPNFSSGVMRWAIDPVAAERLWMRLEQLVGRPMPL